MRFYITWVTGNDKQVGKLSNNKKDIKCNVIIDKK